MKQSHAVLIDHQASSMVSRFVLSSLREKLVLPLDMVNPRRKPACDHKHLRGSDLDPIKLAASEDADFILTESLAALVEE